MKRFLLGSSLVAVLGCCVARGTRVRTPGGMRRVEELRLGDEVCCADPDTGQLVTGRLAAIRTARRECVTLGYGEGELIVTSDHPLYCPVTRRWAPAGDWALGQRTQLLRVELERQTPVEVDRRSTFSGVHQVFDLTVDHPLHNFVANGVLVHNKSPPRHCLVETVNLRSETSCGPIANLAVESSTDCEVTVLGADFGGLPSRGTTNGDLQHGFSLKGVSDAGFWRSCEARPADGGFAIHCAPLCPIVECDGGTSSSCTSTTGPDGGTEVRCSATCPDDCDVSCSGMLARP